MRMATVFLCTAMTLALPGCVAKAVFDVATLPVKATAQAADWATTSGDEADRNHGRKVEKKCREKYDADYCER